MDLIDQGHTHPPIIKRSFLYTKSPGATLGSTSRDNKTLFLDDKNKRGIKQSKSISLKKKRRKHVPRFYEHFEMKKNEFLIIFYFGNSRHPFSLLSSSQYSWK